MPLKSKLRGGGKFGEKSKELFSSKFLTNNQNFLLFQHSLFHIISLQKNGGGGGGLLKIWACPSLPHLPMIRRCF